MTPRLPPLHPGAIVAHLTGPAAIRDYLAARRPAPRPRRRVPAQQIPMPWQPLCCAEMARVRGWGWRRMARLIRASLHLSHGSSMRGVLVSLENLEPNQ